MTQDYQRYQSEDFEVWKILFERQCPNIQTHDCSEFKESLQRIGFQSNRIPDFNEVNGLLMTSTGWQIEVVPAIVPIRDFFIMLSKKHFPSTTWLRSMQQLDYLSEPDMFHDCFGHMPMLINSDYCLFLDKLAEIGMRYIDQEEYLELLGRLYWFSIEFGLVKENGIPKILGAGLISSFGEALQSVDPSKATHIPFNLETILKTSYINSSMQHCYFELDSLSSLYQTTNLVEDQMLGLIQSGFEVEVSGMMM